MKRSTRLDSLSSNRLAQVLAPGTSSDSLDSLGEEEEGDISIDQEEVAGYTLESQSALNVETTQKGDKGFPFSEEAKPAAATYNKPHSHPNSESSSTSAPTVSNPPIQPIQHSASSLSSTNSRPSQILSKGQIPIQTSNPPSRTLNMAMDGDLIALVNKLQSVSFFLLNSTSFRCKRHVGVLKRRAETDYYTLLPSSFTGIPSMRLVEMRSICEYLLPLNNHLLDPSPGSRL